MSVRLDPSKVVSYVGQGALRRTGSWVWYPGAPTVGEEGLFTFARASTGTFVDRTGNLRSAEAGVPRTNWTDGEARLLLELARTNLHANPEAFDLWPINASNSSTDANAATAPDGTATADRLNRITTVGSQSHSELFVASAAAARYAVSVWFKADTYTAVDFAIRDFTAAAWPAQSARIISGPGAVVVSSGIARVSGLSTSEWTRVEVVLDAAATATNDLRTLIYPGGTSVAGTGGLFAWGAMAVEGAFAGSYHASARAVEVASRTLSPGVSLPTDPFARYTRWVAGMDGDGGLSAARIWQVGDGAVTSLDLVWSGAASLSLRHFNGITGNTAQVGSLPVSAGDTVEALVLWNGDGTGTLIVSVNGATATSATLSGITPASAWNGGAVTYLNSRDAGSNAGAMDLADDVLYRTAPSGSAADLMDAFRTLPLVA